MQLTTSTWPEKINGEVTRINHWLQWVQHILTI